MGNATRLSMGVLGVALLAIACTAPDKSRVTGTEVTPSPLPSETPASFSDDAGEAWDLVRSGHARPFFALSRPDMRSMYSRLEARAPDMNRPEFLVELMRITARSGHTAGRDGHSGVFPLDDHDPELHLYPLQLYWFPEGLFVTQSLADDQGLVGTEVVSIDRIPIHRIIDAVEPLVPRDNEMTMRARLPQFLLTQEVLEGLGIVSGDAEFVFRSADGRFRRKLVPLPAGEYADAAGIFHPMVPAFLPQKGRPLYLSHRQRDFFLTYLGSADAIYLQYNLTLEYTDDIADDLVALYRTKKPDKVIVDLRHNPGGDNNTYDSLLKALSAGSISNNADVIVLLGRGTFSAAGHFVIDLMERLDVTLVGERSGFAPNQFGDPTSTALEASGLTANAGAVEWIKTRRSDQRLWLQPDLAVGVSASDFFAARDPVLSAALAL